MKINLKFLQKLAKEVQVIGDECSIFCKYFSSTKECVEFHCDLFHQELRSTGYNGPYRCLDCTRCFSEDSNDK